MKSLKWFLLMACLAHQHGLLKRAMLIVLIGLITATSVSNTEMEF